MKILIFNGGLGNQIYEYGFYDYVRKKWDKDVYYIPRKGNSHNGFELEKWFDIDIKLAPLPYRLYFKIIDFLKQKGLVRSPWNTDEIFEDIPKEVYFDAFWQNKKYLSPGFIHFKKMLLNPRNDKVLEDIESTNSICLHIRRGDYLKPQYSPIYAGVCTLEYYNKALSIVKQKYPDAKYFVFSDDIEWVKNNMALDNATYVDWNTGADSAYDMYLMSHAKANIIANSSFSFWGAYLNQNNNMVIYPKQWYNPNTLPIPDIFPDNWIGL